jgi:uncharacterized iron-regulated protein
MKKTLLAVLIPLAWAAQAQPPETRLKEITVTATRVEADADAVAATVTTLGRKALDQRAPRDEADLLRDEPDVALARDLRRFGATRPNINGRQGGPEDRALQVQWPDRPGRGREGRHCLPAEGRLDGLRARGCAVRLLWPPRRSVFGTAALVHTAALVAALVLALVGAACTSVPGAGAEHIVEVSSGRHITRAELLASARASDYVLLGELHDNALHHARRGELLAELGARSAVVGKHHTVVAEHMPRGQRVDFAGELLLSLTAAGFDAKGWRWPLHEPLFAGVARSGAVLAGANAPRELARQVAREGEAVVPTELGAVLDAAPLSPAAQAALDADLVRGHCGQLAGARLVNIRLAQRTRDASMWLALRDALGNAAPATGAGVAVPAASIMAPADAGPAVLVAGNGHVRSDYGVAQLAARLQPRSRILSVAFVEPGTTSTGAPYTHLWVTAAAQRDDPCSRLGDVLRPPAAAGPKP